VNSGIETFIKRSWKISSLQHEFVLQACAQHVLLSVSEQEGGRKQHTAPNVSDSV